jgi:hypothetical protein
MLLILEVRLLQICNKCGKANQPTRKFCIRCGASLIKPTKPQAPVAPTKPPVTETPRAAPPSKEPKKVEAKASASVTTDDKWVKPSEVSKDRVRVVGGAKQKSELDKAREAFAKAESAGIDEADGSGIVESRMLRASEVRELLEGPGAMMGTEQVPAPRMMEGSEPLPPEAQEMMAPAVPSSSQIEESILGSKSGFVEKKKKTVPAPQEEMVEIEAETVSPQISEDFSSSRYAAEGEASVKAAEPDEIAWSHEERPQVVKKEEKKIVDDAIDLVITCPDCGKTISVDMFEYPKEVYSAMAAARMKQARFFIVQGKGNEALRVVRIANALYTKAGDKIGLQEVRKLIETLAKKV